MGLRIVINTVRHRGKKLNAFSNGFFEQNLVWFAFIFLVARLNCLWVTEKNPISRLFYQNFHTKSSIKMNQIHYDHSTISRGSIFIACIIELSKDLCAQLVIVLKKKHCKKMIIIYTVSFELRFRRVKKKTNTDR